MSIIFRCSLAFSLVLSLALASSAQDPSTLPYYDVTWSKPYEPFRVAGNLYYVGTHDLACYLVATPEGHILINSGLAESGPLIRKSVEALGYNFNDIKILLTTHAHYDHVGALAEIKKMTNAKMMVHEADASVLADGGSSDFALGGKGGAFAPVTADKLLKDGDTVSIGKTKLVVLHHPGHTKGATSFLVDVTDDKRTWKVLIVNMPTILRETHILGMPAYPNVAKDYQYTLEALQKLQFDLWVASHADQFSMHRKHKPGDPYQPEVFSDRNAYDAAVSGFQREYDRRVKRGR